MRAVCPAPSALASSPCAAGAGVCRDSPGGPGQGPLPNPQPGPQGPFSTAVRRTGTRTTAKPPEGGALIEVRGRVVQRELAVVVDDGPLQSSGVRIRHLRPSVQRH